MPEKVRKLSSVSKYLEMLPSYFDYIFVYLRQKVRLRPELSPKFLSTSSPNPTRLITLVRMPGLLIKFFTSFHKNWVFLEKINGLLYFRFDNCGPLEGGARSKCLQILPS